MESNTIINEKGNGEYMVDIISQYVGVAVEAVQGAAKELLDTRERIGRQIGCEEGGREVKLLADEVANTLIAKQLQSTGLSILSEETGFLKGLSDSCLQWVVDPLDGSVNYLRGIDYCAVSVALCDGEKPIAGIIYDLNKNRLVQGIVGRGAMAAGKVISPSCCSELSKAILATGFPARMKFDEDTLCGYVKHMLKFQKVRMFGSAVQSCLAVADGRVDGYFEQDIMLWDVAAGLAVIEAAGGGWRWQDGRREYAKKVWACCPGLINEQMME